MRKHRATGNPRGRPSRLPFDLGKLILDSLARRVDEKTGLAKPEWKSLARELGVSCSTIARQMTALRSRGAVESVIVHTGPKTALVYYRLHE